MTDEILVRFPSGIEYSSLPGDADYPLAQEIQRLRDGIEAISGDLWRIAPCGCGHRADLHRLDAGCIGGLTLCQCPRSFTSLLTERLRALLDTAATEATR